MAGVGAVAIMAGGKGTRMRSSLTKVRHHVGGLPAFASGATSATRIATSAATHHATTRSP